MTQNQLTNSIIHNSVIVCFFNSAKVSLSHRSQMGSNADQRRTSAHSDFCPRLLGYMKQAYRNHKSYSPSIYYNFITPHILNRFILLVNTYFLLQARSAEVCADVLISNDLRGNDSHGVSNMLRKVIIESNQRNSINQFRISYFTNLE